MYSFKRTPTLTLQYEMTGVMTEPRRSFTINVPCCRAQILMLTASPQALISQPTCHARLGL